MVESTLKKVQQKFAPITVAIQQPQIIEEEKKEHAANDQEPELLPQRDDQDRFRNKSCPFVIQNKLQKDGKESRDD